MTDTARLLSDRVLNMAASATIQMAQQARDLRSKGIDVINLSLGEPDFDTPAHIKAAAEKALADGYTKYPPVPGYPALQEAICAKFKKENQLDYTPNQVVVSNGAKQSIANLSLALLGPGDEAIILAPYWVSYMEIIKLGQATPVIVSAGIEDDYKVGPAALEKAINGRTKFVLFSSPCNPTGSVYTREELQALAEVIKKYPDVLVISDEIYEYINFQGEHVSMAQLDGMKERTIVVNGFSKGFAMTGWRLGYMVAPQPIAKACAKIQGQFTSGANSFSQQAAITALNSPRTATLAMRDAFLDRRQLIMGLLSPIEGVKINKPAGAFYIFPDVSYFINNPNTNKPIPHDVALCEYILHEGHVAVVPGSAFGAPGCIRISYAASELEIRSAVERIQKALTNLMASMF